MKHPTETRALPRLSAGDTIAFLLRVVLPTFGKGLMIRRPAIVSLAARRDLDTRAVAEMERLAARHGGGARRLLVPGRPQVVVLSAGDLVRVLSGAPEPYSPATREKIAAVGHFEPNASLISRGEERAVRRRLSDDVLESDRTDHTMAGRFLAVVREETAPLVDLEGFGWQDYRRAWMRAVRRIVLGDGAGDDEAVTDDLDRLRRAGNWAFLHPRRRRVMRRYHARLEEHLQRAEPGSLAAAIAARPRRPDEATADQVTHWLFAFDAASMAGVRALALLVTHPEALARARPELDARAPGPFLRGAILDALRLYATTPAILRETTEDVTLPDGTLPAGAHVILYAPFFHRSDAFPEAHRFAPEIWLPGGAAEERPYVPFSGGPAICPARHFVPLLAGEMVRHILASADVSLAAGQALDPGRPLPGTLDHGALRFRLARRRGEAVTGAVASQAAV